MSSWLLPFNRTKHAKFFDQKKHEASNGAEYK